MFRTGSTLTSRETALARHHTYTLLSALFLEGLTADLLPYIRALPDLSAVLPHPFRPDEAAAVHQALFRFNIFPHEAIFLDSDGLLGGDITDQVSRTYREAGFAPANDGSSADHIGHELALLAFLCRAEADAWEDEQPQIAARMQQIQQNFLGKHLLRWLFPFVLAIKQQENQFFTAAANIMAEFVISHFSALSPGAGRALSQPSAALLPDVPDFLQDEKTGLKEIAGYLVTPVFSGIYLSRDDVGRLARTYRLPRGFGKRTLMLHNLLKAGVQYDSLPALLTEIESMLRNWQEMYHVFLSQSPEMMPFLRPWLDRVQESMHLLVELKREARETIS